jgi:hypothetical protein
MEWKMNRVWGMAGMHAAPGTFAQGLVQLPGVSARIPLFLINGAAEGPLTVILGGIYGCEYTSIDAAIQLGSRFKGLELRGRLAVIPVVSKDAYAARSLYVHPVDRKNINRYFPGDKNGTETERLAFQIYNTFLLPSDYVIDLHGGDMCETLMPHIYWYRTSDTALNERARSFAKAFCIPYIYGSKELRSAYQSAASAGKVSVLVEAGQQGILNPALAFMMVDGTLNALCSMGVLAGTPFEPSGQTEIEKYLWVESDQFGA